LDFKFLTPFRHHGTACSLALEAVLEHGPNRFRSAHGVHPHLPVPALRRSLPRLLSCWDQFLCLAFAQLTYRVSLRDIETCLRAQQPRLYHVGFRRRLSRATPADANETRDWRIYRDFAQLLIGIARDLYRDEPFGVELSETVYAFDSTTIDLCLSPFPWGQFRRARARSSCTRCWTCAGAFRPVFIEPPNPKTQLKTHRRQ
jgi:Domain of unknown function (DUF4372)